MINKCYLCRKDGKIMKKKTVKILMGVALISTLLGACSTNRSTQNEQKTLNTEISKIVKNHSESTYEENTKENTEKVVEKNTEDNLYLTTDYKVEDYCNGYFIVSKMDGRLFGVINSKGKEVIPLKYDEAGNFSDGLAKVRIGGKYGKYSPILDKIEIEDARYGYINNLGIERIPILYSHANDFSEGCSLYA